MTFEQNCSGRPVDLVDQRLELAGAGVHRQQPAVAVADQQPPVARDGQPERPATGVGDDSAFDPVVR